MPWLRPLVLACAVDPTVPIESVLEWLRVADRHELRLAATGGRTRQRLRARRVSMCSEIQARGSRRLWHAFVLVVIATLAVLHGDKTLSRRADTPKAFDHPLWAGAVGTFGTSHFGRMTPANDFARSVQFQVRVGW